MNNITVGTIPFREWNTWYREAASEGDGIPILLLHGGPGSTHNYMELLDPWAEKRPVITYDQLGCGESFVEGRPDLWVMDTWLDELENLREKLDLTEVILLGQSFGGMLALSYVLERRPSGVRGLVLSSTLSNASLWGREQHRMLDLMGLSEDDVDTYMQKLCAGPYTEESPECLRRTKRSGTESYTTAWGPNEFTPVGTLSGYDLTERLSEIRIPTLVVSGTNDLCTPLIAKTMADRIPGARWLLMEGCRHMCFADDTNRYLQEVGAFLDSVDAGRN